MHKQTKQQNPTFKSTLSNERIFLSICFECPVFCWISWHFIFFFCVCVCVFFRVKFMFVYSNCQWFACLFLVPGLGLAGMAIYLFAKVWECISHRLGRVIFIVLFHFDCDVVFLSFVIIFSTIFRTIFICFMSNLRVVSQRLSVNTSAGPCAQGLSCAWSKDQGK